MKMSNMLVLTLREVPAEAEIASHKLMLRAGMMRKMASGIYNYMPLGLKALKNVEDIIREEAPDVLRYFREQDVTLKVISGDNPVTVSAVAMRAGVENADKYVDARELPTDVEELK